MILLYINCNKIKYQNSIDKINQNDINVEMIV
jgi:hypothetical protein